MHICFITNEYPKKNVPHGGVGSFLKTLASKLVSQNFEITVLGINNIPKREEENENGIKIIRLPKSKIPKGSFLQNRYRINKEIEKIHKNKPISVIETAELGLAFLKKITGIKYIIRMHGGHHFFAKYENRPLNKWKVFQEKKSFSKADELVAVSDFVGKETLDLLEQKDRKYTVIYNPISTERFSNVEVKNTISHKILYVGSLVEKKGVRQLIQAIPYLRDTYPNIVVDLVGPDVKIKETGESYKALLEKEVKNLQIEKHVNFIGVVPNTTIPEVISAHDICVYPSHMEAMPLAWLEVLASKKPFLGSNIGPAKECIKDGETALLCDPNSPEDIALKIASVFENYEAALQRAEKSKIFISDTFETEKIVKDNVRFFKSIIK
ncbi:glycosyltransferase family 4 protein [Aureivirga sp. CE67]|uniref:glycosyltransferase family 4 protein n=1 Tax=Aureivirga sp. CE67 TaxID=1788983 RepID=UPI0018C9CCCF|nr:glycosyltransferase family 4 protein [Aureivirga sp. CE67]